jgi:hypothetical protein
MQMMSDGDVYVCQCTNIVIVDMFIYYICIIYVLYIACDKRNKDSNNSTLTYTFN